MIPTVTCIPLRPLSINHIFLLLRFFMLLTLSACISTNSTITIKPESRDSLPRWPQSPQESRILFIRTLSSLSDIGAEKSWLRKGLGVLFGEDEQSFIMLRPYGIFADADRMYVTDPGISAAHIFDMTNKKYFSINKAGGTRIESPIGIAADREAIYITDSVLRKVFVFDKKGNYSREIGAPDNFMRPTGITIDNDRIYVVDTHANKVLIFAKDTGRLLLQIGKNGTGYGEFHYPTNIFIGKDGLLYVTDSLNFRIQIFDRDGNFISAFGKHGDSSGDFSKPKGIAVDSDGHIYVADADFDNIQIFDRNGKLLLVFGQTGRGKGELVLPAGIFIDHMDRIYVADSYNKRIQIFQYLTSKQ